MFVEYAMRIRPRAITAKAVMTESVIMFTMSTTMTRSSFPRGGQWSILELYARASICMCSDVPEAFSLGLAPSLLAICAHL